jgi:hypothetical protein
MPRLSKKDVHAALEKAANNILSARGDDPIVSRKDIRLKINQLEGTERKLTEIFYRFMDHRDYKAGARITAKDVESTLEYAKKHLIDNYDLNQNGLSKTEIEKMSLTGKLAVKFARELKNAGLEESIKTSEDILEILSNIGNGLLFLGYGSEADLDLEPFHRDAALTELNVDTFSAAMGLDPDNIHEELAIFEPSLNRFEDWMLSGYFEIDMRRENIELPRVIELIQFMKTNLKDLSIAIVGRDESTVDSEHPAYWVGIGPDGDIVGFKSAVVWT